MYVVIYYAEYAASISRNISLFFLLQSIIPSFMNPYSREYSNWTSIVGKIRFVWP